MAENRIGDACWFRKWCYGTKKLQPWAIGTLRMWGTDYEEYESGPGLYPVGVVEDSETGLCHSIPVHRISFKNPPAGG